jgi:hypothetical protein
LNLVQELEDSLASHNIPLEEHIPLLPDCRGLLIILARPLQLLQGHSLGFVGVPKGLCFVGPKVGHLRV